MRFVDREDAGRRLASLLLDYEREQPIVLALPRGGVPIGYEVARALRAPLDVWVVRKVGAPGHSELGLGAVAEGGIVYLNRELMEEVGATDEDIQELVREQAEEVSERVKRFRGTRTPPRLQGRTVILVDDGIATGGTIRAAIEALRQIGPRKIVIAVPVGASQSLEELQPLVEDVVWVHATPSLYAIGAWYEDFQQVPDAEVVRLLERARQRHDASETRPAMGEAPGEEQEVSISAGDALLGGTLGVPLAPRGLVLFAHGSGSSRFSPRNRHVAAILRRHGLATLLFDLLTSEEETIDEVTAELRFDIDLLARRLVQVTDWAASFPATRGLAIGYFGSSTGAAAALLAASERPMRVGAIVSRGGRPDLAWDRLEAVRAPTLFIVGGRDSSVIEFNRCASERMSAPRELQLIPGASHLFEEPGALDSVAELAGRWFIQHLSRATLEEEASPA
ncbi:phosphoribosyltransferase family protein [Hyalangium gracile]|uniref:phosphoribosyltransferase family protein n=1 Tax=Hyalangium gracile TaxID=394092 RepID=UPI001CCFFEB4|nr:phosphoribosyltransferase family protein [Hyalangium gracile]